MRGMRPDILILPRTGIRQIDSNPHRGGATPPLRGVLGGRFRYRLSDSLNVFVGLLSALYPSRKGTVMIDCKSLIRMIR